MCKKFCKESVKNIIYYKLLLMKICSYAQRGCPQALNIHVIYITCEHTCDVVYIVRFEAPPGMCILKPGCLHITVLTCAYTKNISIKKPPLRPKIRILSCPI